MLAGLQRFVLWDYRRASWQYDVMVVLILAFIFLTPRAWFRDQPRASHVVALPSEGEFTVFWMEPELLAGVPAGERQGRVNLLLKLRTGRKLTLVRLEPIFNSEEEIKGYMAYAKP